MKVVKWVLGIVGGLLVLAVGAAWWLLSPEAPPETSEYRLDVAELRRLAASVPGPRPLRVNAQRVALAELPRAAVFAGEPFTPHVMVHQSFQIVFPDRWWIVDAAFGPEMHAEMGGEHPHDAEAWATVQRALAGAEVILVTHEHGDHIDGLALHPEPERLAPRLRWSAEQLANTERLDQVSMPAVLRELEPLRYDHTLALGPGVVLVKAAGHTPGSQIVYVALEDGRELLLVGDVAWHMDAIRNLHYRPRLVTEFFLGEDRRAVLHQYRALHDLARDHPEVQIVVSHDPAQRDRLLAEGRLGDRFWIP